MSAKPLEITIGELAERSGVATSAIRYYEELGLIFSRRTSGNQRRYHRAMLRRVAFIRASQSAGIPLADIGEVLSALGSRQSPTPKMWERASRQWLEDINRRIGLLERIRDLMGSCVGCGCLSMTDCRLLNPDDAMAKSGPGPHRLLDDI